MLSSRNFGKNICNVPALKSGNWLSSTSLRGGTFLDTGAFDGKHVANQMSLHLLDHCTSIIKVSTRMC